MNNAIVAPWEKFGHKVQMLVEQPKNAGMIEQSELKELGADLFVYTYGKHETGDEITLYWAIDSDGDTILLSRFSAFGSPAVIAANEMAALLCRNKTIDQASEITYKGLEYFLRDNPSTPALPKSDRYAISMALDAIRCAGLEFYNEKDKDSEDTVVVSNDSPMSLRSIRDIIKLHDITTIDEITNYTKVGKYDKGSIEPGMASEGRKHYLADILKDTRIEIEASKADKQVNMNLPFREMELATQIQTINRAIDDSGVRQYLIMDGGDMEILDVKLNGEDIDIYIRYLGACNGCASSTTGTLFAIETTLKEKIDDKVRVLPL